MIEVPGSQTPVTSSASVSLTDRQLPRPLLAGVISSDTSPIMLTDRPEGTPHAVSHHLCGPDTRGSRMMIEQGVVCRNPGILATRPTLDRPLEPLWRKPQSHILHRKPRRSRHSLLRCPY